MVNTAFDKEAHLFTEQEAGLLEAFKGLSYNARYCFVRLVLRKTNAWHALTSMEKFKKEIGEDGLQPAIEALCSPISQLGVKDEVKDEDIMGEITMSKVEIIDLTGDLDDKDEVKPTLEESGTSRLDEKSVQPSLHAFLSSNPFPHAPNFDFFLEDESAMGLEEALDRLNNDQLKDLMKQTRAGRANMNKPNMIRALLLYAYSQTPLSFQSTPKKGNFGKDGLRQTTLGFTTKAKPPNNQHRRLLAMVLQKLGKCVRVNPDIHLLVARLNVVYDRCTQYPKSLLIPSLLTSFKKRTYPEYNYNRDGTIWPTPEDCLSYFEALCLEDAIERELEPASVGRHTTKTPAPFPMDRNQFVTPVPPARRSRTTPMSGASGIRAIDSPATVKKEDAPLEESETTTDKKTDEKLALARKVMEVFDKVVFPKWKRLLEQKQWLVALKQEQDLKPRTPGLERFEPGFVYTRMFSKAMRALATLKLYKQEAEALDALLDQPFWRRGKRAKWYERRGLIQMTYLCREEYLETGKTKADVLYHAMEGVRQALEDEDTGIVFRPMLVRRLQRLEKQLKIPEPDRVKCEGELREATAVEFSAERLTETSRAMKVDGNGRVKGPNGAKDVRNYFSPAVPKPGAANKENKPTAKTSLDWKSTGKSVWRGLCGGEVNVETRALQHYELMGFKGFHSETRILTTIFALLFWDIIFADVPGAFETPYQTAPLDIGEDSFYRARKDAIDARLEELKQEGRAKEIAGNNDLLHREKNTWCVGVRWDICTREDLLEIIECLGGESLSIICRLFCDDYAGRSSGVPDLIVWNAEQRVCKFVEVKGPGDRAQENQRLWFDSLKGAGAIIELCKVHDEKHPPKPKKEKEKMPGTRGNKGKSKGKSKGKGKARARVGDSDVETASHDDQVDQLDDNPWGPSTVLGKRCRRPPDENEDQLPVFHSTATPPTSPPTRHQGRPEPPPKRRKTGSISPS
ncbi:hypothetical protein DXG03_009205 [Asterophora parasitica]|uniref:Fanconi-associated nuclease n=1 Tax=Asterophora parasitica TaxID=117018 RepID=A0A9P7KB24_9AGAR|nr:hypothetical protein DXG03_009205 [Asterophora parasitica]